MTKTHINLPPTTSAENPHITPHGESSFDFSQFWENPTLDFLARAEAVARTAYEPLVIPLSERVKSLERCDRAYFDAEITWAEWCEAFDELCDNEMKKEGK